VAPPFVTLWSSATAPASQEFLMIGTAFILPILVFYVVWSYWGGRGKVRAGTVMVMVNCESFFGIERQISIDGRARSAVEGHRSRIQAGLDDRAAAVVSLAKGIGR
jgi:hypothetical protein